MTVAPLTFRERLAVELALLRERRRFAVVLGAVAAQYAHGVFTQLAYRHHHPSSQPLHDVGFSLLPALPQQWRWASEALFAGLASAFVGWSFSPLFAQRRFSCALLWTRLLAALVVCQVLRVASFSATQLPGPAPHCRLGAPTAYRAPATAWWQHLVVDVSRQVAHSCGDLVFSSHMTFVLLGVLAYSHHGRHAWLKAGAWAAAAGQAGLIVAARKHYTLDVVVAWYTVPLVWHVLHLTWAARRTCARCSVFGSTPSAACAACAPLGAPCASPRRKHAPPQQLWAAGGVAAVQLPVSCELPASPPHTAWPHAAAWGGRAGSPVSSRGSRAGTGGGSRSGSWVQLPALAAAEAGEAAADFGSDRACDVEAQVLLKCVH